MRELLRLDEGCWRLGDPINRLLTPVCVCPLCMKSPYKDTAFPQMFTMAICETLHFPDKYSVFLASLDGCATGSHAAT